MIQASATNEINLNNLDYKGRNALMLASINGHYSVVQTLLENIELCSINFNATDINGKTALVLAKENGHKSTVKILRKEWFKQKVAKMRTNLRLFFWKIRNRILNLVK